MHSITSANAVIMLVVPGLFPVPQQLQGFAVDDIFDTEVLDPAEVQMGVDGKLSAGFVFVPTKQNFALQADSPSNLFFEALYAAQQAAKDIYRIGGVINLPAVGRTYAMFNGVLTGYKPTADGKKVLQPRKFSITWESMLGAPI